MPPPGPTSATPHADLPRRFGDYTLLEHLAHGGRGDVYVAIRPDAAGRDTCVIKCLRADLTTQKSYVNRFVAEARIAVQLHHPNIATVVDVGRVDATYYLAFEHVVGRTLREVAERAAADRGALPVPLVIELVCDLLDALDYAHRRRGAQSGEPLGFVHREVSPSTVMISYEGALKLTDVGLARSALELEMTLPGSAPGRLAYQAPEQLRGDPLDGRADLFAVAVLCYELVTGERYYAGKAPEAVVKLASAGGHVPAGFSRLPTGLRAILGRALESDPERRTASCDELRRALREDQRNTRAQPGDLKALMTSLYPGAAAASRRHLAALTRGRPADDARGGETVRFVPATPSTSADAATVVREASAAAPRPDATGASRAADDAPEPPSTIPPDDVDDTAGDWSSATLQIARNDAAGTVDRAPSAHDDEPDAVTLPEIRAAQLDDDPQGPTSPLRRPAPAHLANPPAKRR